MAKLQTHRWKALDAVAITADAQSNWMDIEGYKQGSCMIAVTTTGNNGQFSIQVSNQEVDPIKLAGDQSQITIFDTLVFDPVIPVLAGANVILTQNMENLNFKWMRIKFTKGLTYTNGTATAYIVVKE
jgi:hypothetical protein